MTKPKLFADECCPAQLVNALRTLEFDVVYVIESGAGLSDLEQAREAYRQQRVLLSADYDFGELAIRYSEPFTGLVLLSPNLKLENVGDVQAIAGRIGGVANELVGRLTVFETDQVRQRAL